MSTDSSYKNLSIGETSATAGYADTAGYAISASYATYAETAGSGGGGGADPGASYLTVALTASLDNERALAAGTGIIFNDAGANNDFTVGVNNSVVATVSGTNFTGPVTASSGFRATQITGSLTQTTAGISAFVAGADVSIISSSNGQVRISNTAGWDNKPSYLVLGSALTGSLPNGLLFKTGAGLSFTAAGSNYTIFSYKADEQASYLTLANTASLANERALATGTGLKATDAGANSTYTLAINDGVVATLTGSKFTGAVDAPQLTGSLTKLQNGTSAFVAGTDITITSGSNGQVRFDNAAGFDRAPSFLTLANTGSLNNERLFTPGTGLKATDAGANSTYTLGINDTTVATVSGTNFTGVVKASGGLTGSLQKTPAGTSAFVAGDGITITSGSGVSGQITIAASGGGGGGGGTFDIPETIVTINTGGTRDAEVNTTYFCMSSVGTQIFNLPTGSYGDKIFFTQGGISEIQIQWPSGVSYCSIAGAAGPRSVFNAYLYRKGKLHLFCSGSGASTNWINLTGELQ